MKKLTILLLLLANIALAAEDDKKYRLVREYMETADINKTVELYSKIYTSQAMIMYPDVPSSIWESKEYEIIIKKYVSDLYERWSKVYYQHLSIDELEELLAFLRTPLGKKFLSLQLKLEPVFAETSIRAAENADIELQRLLNENKHH
jgi:hypothetical protein